MTGNDRPSAGRAGFKAFVRRHGAMAIHILQSAAKIKQTVSLTVASVALD
jgi:hypothetical protein